MFKGFYNLTSGMLTHGKWLDVISNNISNASSPGFKMDRFTDATFEQVMWQVVGNHTKTYTEIGEQSWITAPRMLRTDHTQGAFEQTDLPLDFAIEGTGFFAVQTTDGDTLYTRNGSFSLDNEGYLCLPEQGRVLSPGREPIQVRTDKVEVDAMGRLYTASGTYMGQLGTFQFENPGEQLQKNDTGLFASEAEPEPVISRLHQGMVESSNTDWAQQLTEMIAVERTYQGIAQAVRIYDEMMNKATQDAGRL